MRRPLFNIIILTLIGVVAIWLGDRPGDLVLRWPGYELRTSVATGIGVTLVIFFILLVLWRGYAWLINWPERFKAMRRKQKRHVVRRQWQVVSCLWLRVMSPRQIELR